MPIRVVLAEDNYLVREGVATLLGHAPEIEVVATCGDLDELLAAVATHEPDVVVGYGRCKTRKIKLTGRTNKFVELVYRKFK